MEKDKNTTNHTNETITEEKSDKSRLIWRILILGAVFLVLVALSIGIIKVVPRALSSLASVNVSISSLFSPKEKISVSSDKSKTLSGESFNLSWKHSGASVEGFYTLTTTCQTNFHLEYPVGTTRNVVDCNHSIQLTSSTTAINLIGVNNDGSAVTAPLTINFVSKETNKIVVSGSTSVVINASSSPSSSGIEVNQPIASSTPPSTQNTQSTPTGNVPTSNVGPGDLTIRITALGIQDPNTGAFVQTTNINTNNRVIIKFEVVNIGSGPSGTWNLNTNLPAVNVSDQTKSIRNEASLPAGLAVSGELYFDYIQTGANRSISINVNTNGPEIRTDNNSATIAVAASGNNSYPTNGVNGTDLSVRILDTGVVDRNSGSYTATTYIPASARAGVRFQVTNLGNVPSNVWNFTASLANNSYNNNTNSTVQNNQPSLGAGENRVYVAGFDGLQYGANNSAIITIDPYNQIGDVNRSNNTATANLYVNSY